MKPNVDTLGSANASLNRLPQMQPPREGGVRVCRKPQDILSPEEKLNRLELADLLDADSIQSLMDEFHKMVRVPMAIIDLQGRVLVGKGWQDICTQYHRVHPDTCRNCIESDLLLTKDVPPGEFKLYKCKNNMWDVSTPIMICDRHVGNVFMGQFFLEGEKIDYELFRSQARRYGFDEAGYIAALERVPRLSRETVDTGMRFFLKFARMLSQASYGSIQMARLLAQRDALTAQLQRNEESLNRAQELARVGSWELDLVNNRLSWSDEVYRIFGLRPQEFGATYEAFLDHVHPDDRGAVDAAYSGSLREGRDIYEIEHRVVRKATGEVRIVHERCQHFRDAAGKIVRSVGMVQDITERKRSEEYRRLTTDALHVLNTPGEIPSLMTDIVTLIQRWGGYDAVGLRLRTGDDFPYYVQAGFSDEFVQAENSLCARDRDGALVHDAAGQPVVECTCGLVLTGRTDPSKPFFTEGGSFWTNESSKLLELKPEEDPRTNPRNRCITNGHESVALIPLKSGKDIVGLLQLNDRRKGAFTSETIRFFEGLSYSISIALGRKRAVEDLRRSNMRNDLLAKTAGELLKTGSPQAAVDGLCREVMALLDCQVFFNFLADKSSGRLHLNACAGIPEEEARRIEWLDYGVAVCGCVAQSGQRIVAENILETPDPRTDLVKSYGIKAYACHPLLDRGEVLGTLSFGSKTRQRFADDELSVMKTVADLVSIAMQRKQSEQALQQHREHLEELVRERTGELDAERRRFHEVLDALPAYVVLLGMDYRVPFANRFFEERFGKSGGKRCYEYLFKRTEPCENCETFKVLKTGQPHHWEWLGPDGRNYDIHDFPFTDLDGSPLILEMGLDITQRKHAEAELKKATEQLFQAQKMEAVGRLAGGVAHDFNNLMTVVTGYGRRLLRDPAMNSTQRAAVEQMAKAGERAVSLTGQLLAFSRKQVIKPVMLDINESVEEMRKMLPTVLGEDIAVALELQSGSWPVLADPTQITQVIMNLAVNARDAMPTGGHLTIRTANVQAPASGDGIHQDLPPGRYVLLSIADTGTGMSEETRSRLFEPFFTTKRHGEGTGLGLPSVYGIVQQNGGHIRVDTEIGRGTTFSIYLPATGVETGDEAMPQSSNGQENLVPRGSETILILEDESSVCELLTVELQELGYRVLPCQTVGEAIRAVEEHGGPVDLLLTDIVLPGMSGPTLAKTLRDRGKVRHVMFMSGHTEKHIVQHGVLKEGVAFIGKPFTAEALAIRVRDILDGKTVRQ